MVYQKNNTNAQILALILIVISSSNALLSWGFDLFGSSVENAKVGKVILNRVNIFYYICQLINFYFQFPKNLNVCSEL